MNHTNTKTTKIASVVMLIIGVLLVAAGILMHISNAVKIEKSQKTIAVISEIKAEQKVKRGKPRINLTAYADFEYNDIEYKHYKIGYHDPSMYEGKEIEIYVYESPNGNIEVITESGNILMLVIFSVIGIICFNTGIAEFIVRNKSKQNPQAIK